MGQVHGFEMVKERTGNWLLDVLSGRDFGRIAESLRKETIPLSRVVIEPGAELDYAYFPIDCVLSSTILLKDGTAVEAAAIGREGIAGIGLVVDDRSCPYRIVQQVEGRCLRVPADLLREALKASPPFHELLCRYSMTLLQQAGQNVACALSHRLEERLARWLLATADRVGRDEFLMTQGFLSEMLGVRRQTVSITAAQLQEAGLISYRRGKVRLVDRAGLLLATCECYETTRAMYERLMRPDI